MHNHDQNHQFGAFYSLILCLALWSGVARALDAIFSDGFETRFPADAAAARFLTQASFGPSAASIATVRAQGFDAWISAQMALTPSLTRPYLEQQNAQGLSTGQNQRLNRWFYLAATAPNQLRQRVAFALSEIFVVSDSPDNLVNHWAGIAEYQDILTTNAFGNYGALLKKVALSPQMGRYLSHWLNRKAIGSTEPDENFAHEIMQLFSIGLTWRNLDYSEMLSPQGQPIPTYDQAVIVELAQVFTGFANTCPTPNGLCNPYSGLTSVFSSYLPMACFPLHHDLSSKQLFDLDPGPAINRVTLPAGPACDPEPPDGSSLETQCFNYCNSDLDAAINALANHPNVAPFLSRQLIQKLITSNPSPGYIAHVATVFNSSGGNIGATVRATASRARISSNPATHRALCYAPNYYKNDVAVGNQRN